MFHDCFTKKIKKTRKILINNNIYAVGLFIRNEQVEGSSPFSGSL